MTAFGEQLGIVADLGFDAVLGQNEVGNRDTELPSLSALAERGGNDAAGADKEAAGRPVQYKAVAAPVRRHRVQSLAVDNQMQVGLVRRGNVDYDENGGPEIWR